MAPAPHKGSANATTKIISAGSRCTAANSTMTIPNKNMMAAFLRLVFFRAAGGFLASGLALAPQARQKRSVGAISAWHERQCVFGAAWPWASSVMVCNAPFPEHNARRGHNNQGVAVAMIAGRGLRRRWLRRNGCGNHLAPDRWAV